MRQPVEIVHIVSIDTVGAQTFVKLVRNLPDVLPLEILMFSSDKKFQYLFR